MPQRPYPALETPLDPLEEVGGGGKVGNILNV